MADEIKRHMLETWLVGDGSHGSWRQQARAVIRREVEAYLAVHVDINNGALLKLVDAAYPFGPRRHHPYKAWLTERRGLIAILDADVGPDLPTVEDYAAVEVAIDLAETDRLSEALALMSQQAPRRLNRACPVCGVKAGRECVNSSSIVTPVPHLGRVIPSRSNGPLFGGPA